MAVRIRLKKLGRTHRPYYRMCAMDVRVPRGGRVLEELGTYDPMVADIDARAVLNAERISHWLSVGALPSEKAGVLIKKYGPNGTCLEKQREALAKLAQPRSVPDPGPPASLPKPPPAPKAETPAAEAEAAAPAAPAESEATAETAEAEAPAEPTDAEQADAEPSSETAETPEEKPAE